MFTPRAVELLLVEDEEDDVELTQRVLAKGRFANHLAVARDGLAALQMLRDPETPRPDLILLDLNMPRMDGRAVLEEVRKDPALKTIPIVVLTTSGDQRDIIDAYTNGANCYITKPVDLHRFQEVLAKVQDFWFSLARLPPRK